MNKVVLIGRVTKDVEVRKTNSGKSYTRFTLAVNRRGKDAGANFISCVAWEKVADVLGAYVKKGNQIGISGRIETGKYEDRDGKTVFTTDVMVEELDLLESRGSTPAADEPTAQQQDLPDLSGLDPDNLPW